MRRCGGCRPTAGSTAGSAAATGPYLSWPKRGCRTGGSPPSPPATSIDTVATIAATKPVITLRPDVDPVVCGPCALVRWLRALHLALTSPATRTLAVAIDRSPAVDGASPHLCRSRRPLTTGIAEVPLLPPIDPRGHLAIDPSR